VEAVSRAVALSGGQPVAVVSLARIYGSALGLPNPGLLPTQRELADQRQRVARAVAAVERAGVEGWGQVAATRRPGRTIARVARARGVRHVVLVTPSQPRWRRFVEGNLVREISRRLSPATTVEAVITIPAEP
jgi:K+-sensing histidine kinase KdpD